MQNTLTAAAYLDELNAEVTSTRKCLERISENTFSFKPHPRSMEMGYLALLVAEIPLWIKEIVEKNEINFATFKHATIKTNAELMAFFEDNVKGAQAALKNVSEEEMEKPFSLKSGDQTLICSPVNENVSSTLNHWVHHRGQLTVYMRLNEIPVPSIYGPSADDKNY